MNLLSPYLGELARFGACWLITIEVVAPGAASATCTSEAEKYESDI